MQQHNNDYRIDPNNHTAALGADNPVLLTTINCLIHEVYNNERIKLTIYARYALNWIHLHCLWKDPPGVMTSLQPLLSGQAASSSTF